MITVAVFPKSSIIVNMNSGNKTAWRVVFTRPDTLIPMLVLVYDGLLYTYAWHVGNSHADIEFLMATGSAKIDYLISNGEFWRLISAVFLHIAPLHLILNLIGLVYLTRFVQDAFCGTAAIIIFLCSGFVGMFASFIFNSNPSMGASGAVYGMAGAMLWSIAWYRRPNRFFWTTGMVVFLGISLLYDFRHQWVDLAAHIGGLTTGLVLGPILPTGHRKEAGTGAITVLLAIVCFSLIQAYRYESLDFDIPLGTIQTVTVDDNVLAWPGWWMPGRIHEKKCLATKVLPVNDRPFIACLRGPMNALLIIGPTNRITGMFDMPPPPNGVSVSRLTKTGLRILMVSTGAYSYILIARELAIRRYYDLLRRLMLLSGPGRFVAFVP